MKYKILFFMFSLKGGGAERTVVNIINNLNKEKFEITLILGTTEGNDYINLLSSKVKVKYLNSSKLRFCIFKLRKAILQEKPDLLFSTLIENNIILLCSKLFTFKKIPTVVREASNRTQSKNVTFFNKVITSFCYNFFANRVIALSKGVKDDLITNFYVNKNKIDVIYNPVEVSSIKKLSDENVEEEDLDFETNKILISVGRLAEAKDYYTLLKAFKKLTLVKENILLVIVGKGPLLKKLVEFAGNLEIHQKVKFIGFKSNPYKYIKKADIFVLSSKWEGFSHVIVESMATGTPVISTNCNSGPREIIGNNEYGMLVPVGDYNAMAEKIYELLQNNDKIKYYIEKGYKRAEYFEADIIVKKYENTFLSLIK